MFKQFTPFTYTGVVRNDRERTPFVPCGATQPLSLGYVNHCNGEPFIAGVELITIERKAVPSDVVKREAAKRCDAIQQETGRRPKGKHLKEIKEEITRELLAKAFPKRKTVPVLWLGEFVLVGTTSASELDLLTSFLTEQGEQLRLETVKTAPPTLAMTEWATMPSDAPFAVGRDIAIELSGDAGRATFKDTSVLSPQVVEALLGASVASIALTSEREVSFVLTADLQVKSLKVAGVAGEGHADAAAAECALMQGELRALMAELVRALGAPAESSDAA